jgi:murein DD-endopeptidase MepM/ murein hydrolase activator NlpD
MPEIDGFDSLVTKLNQAKKTSSDIEKSWEKISKYAKEVGFKGGSGDGGSKGGLPGPGDMSSPTFGGSGGGGGRARKVAEFAVDGTAPNKSGLAQMRINDSYFGVGDAVSYLGQLSGAVNTFLPDVTKTMNRATGFYNAGIYGGNQRSRADLTNATFGTLSKMNGLTSEGSDANVAQFLAARGMSASGDSGSTYQQTLRTIGNAGRYMNISNEDAAASIEGLTSARGSANMLKSFGIYTADLSTGKEKTQGQIFEELAQRLTAGRGQANVEQTQASIRRGALGVTIDSFFQGDQQGSQMFKQYMIDRSRGKKMDLSQEGAADYLGTKDNENPLNAQMALNTSNTGVMGAAEKQYIAGINAATGALQLLNVAAAAVSKSVIGFGSAFTQLLFGAGTTKGLVQGVTSTVDFAGKAAGAVLANPMGAAYYMGVAGATIGLAAGTSAAAMGAASPPPAASTRITGPYQFQPGGGNSSSSGTGGAATGALSSSQMGLGVGASYGAIPTGQGAGVGPDAGRSGYLFDISMVAKGHSVTGAFGSVSSIRGGRPHRGTDYNHNNSPVLAIGDGEVIFTRSTYNHNDATGNSAGNYIAIVHTSSTGDKYTSLYLHLSKVSVKVGDKVRRGQQIGISGNTGHSTGPHLHLEIVKGRTTTPGVGTAISPSDASKIGGSTELSNGSSTTSGSDGGQPNLTEDQAKFMNGILAQNQGQLTGLADLYSGDPTRATAALSNYAKALQIGDLFSKNYTGTYISGDTSNNLLNGGGGTPTYGGGGGGSNVNIVVQVPDVTSADAVKFASLVKQYLDSNTLMSNTGSI